MSLAPPLLEARGVTRLKTAGVLLDRVDLALQPGERVAVVGPSGSGKTLLLRALALLDPLDGGDILWNGQTIANQALPAFRASVIYLHQRPALFDGTVEENLRLPFTLDVHCQRSFDRDRILRLLEALGRGTDFLSKLDRDLSGGEAQIVALVRALQLDPTVVLLDEATSALDRETVLAAERLIDDWRTPLRAVIWVSHDIAQNTRVADRTIAIHRGRVVQGGTS